MVVLVAIERGAVKWESECMNERRLLQLHDYCNFREILLIIEADGRGLGERLGRE